MRTLYRTPTDSQTGNEPLHLLVNGIAKDHKVKEAYDPFECVLITVLSAREKDAIFISRPSRENEGTRYFAEWSRPFLPEVALKLFRQPTNSGRRKSIMARTGSASRLEICQTEYWIWVVPEKTMGLVIRATDLKAGDVSRNPKA